MTVFPVDVDETVRLKVPWDKWSGVINKAYDDLTKEEKYHLQAGPPEYTLAVLIKLEILERVVH